MNKRFFFLSGVPRSGSTVLSSILSQNPKIFTTPTSPLLDLLLLTGNNWGNVSAYQKNHHPDQLKNIYHGIFNSVYKHVDAPIVLDKHRAWPRHIDMIRAVTGYQPKMIITTRDVPEILASFVTILQKNGVNNYIDVELRNANKPINNTTRCRLLWEKYVSVPWTSFKIGWETNRDCLHLVDYKEVINSPDTAIKGIYDFLDIKPFAHKYNSLSNPQPENDKAYGLDGLHDVRPVLKRVSPPAEQILGEEVASYYKNLNLEFWKK